MLPQFVPPKIYVFRQSVQANHQSSGEISYHVKIEDGHSSRVVVLVEDSFEFHVQENRALVESKTSRRIERTSLKHGSVHMLTRSGHCHLSSADLELDNRIWRRWTLLQMAGTIVYR